MNQVKAYQCEFCHRKVGMNKQHIKKHEFLCFHNPQRRACQTCGNFSTSRETVYDRHHGGDPGSSDYEVEVQWCGAKDKDIGKMFPRERYDCRDWTPTKEEG